MSDDYPTHVFDLTVTVRRRVWLSGPDTRELARDMLRCAILGGMNMHLFSKRNEQGLPIERVVSSDIVLEDVEVSDASQTP